MKKFVLFFLVFVSVAGNAASQYVRKLKEPDFFIPYSDRMHKSEILPKIKVIREIPNKTNDDKSKNTVSNESNKNNKSVFNEKPEYKKIYDNYIIELNNYLVTKKFAENKSLENDLSEMADGIIFEVKDEVSNSIKTQEKYDFYMLADKILKN